MNSSWALKNFQITFKVCPALEYIVFCTENYKSVNLQKKMYMDKVKLVADMQKLKYAKLTTI